MIPMLATGLTTYAQQRSMEDFEVIPFIGYSESTYYGDKVSIGDETPSYSLKSSLNFGVKENYYFNDRWFMVRDIV